MINLCTLLIFIYNKIANNIFLCQLVYSGSTVPTNHLQTIATPTRLPILYYNN